MITVYFRNSPLNVPKSIAIDLDLEDGDIVDEETYDLIVFEIGVRRK